MATRRRKRLIALGVSLAVLIGLVVIADRIAAAVAEDKISGLIAAKASESGIESQRPPEVDIGGFPFLTQVFGGEYDQIDMTLNNVGADGFVVPKLHVTAHGVTAALSDVMSGSGPIVAATMNARGEISYESLTTELESTSGVTVTPEGDGMLSVKATVDVAGQPIPVAGTATVSFNGQSLVIQSQGFTADGMTLPPGAQPIVDAFAASFNRDIPMPAMPYGLVLEDLRLEKNAMVVTASAKNVPLA
ncbi:DUF2993 domain-containing protein [Stackebrandtia soli]|uniref:LmeA family phospholipid-binding protein n=1 Tax=Stackebrandtia soli TaxID=1892856 RepID=UPI0039EB44DF